MEQINYSSMSPDEIFIRIRLLLLLCTIPSGMPYCRRTMYQGKEPGIEELVCWEWGEACLVGLSKRGSPSQ
jgi:hypothetical protein